ncbi:MAG: sulfatase-like hydrolase/transferase, partial [Clostridia bacterium]|nr:sulfatase-like hydrolase/transferase [Clostridia bacterium]
LSENGLEIIPVGKIYDIFAGKSLKKSNPTKSNTDGMEKTLDFAKEDFTGLCFTNLVDFDMMYGHRNDVEGYAKAVSEFDSWLGEFIKELKDDDVLMITADHGCDPLTESTDHSREHIPLLVYGKKIKSVNLGTRDTYADIGKTVADLFGIDADIEGESFKNLIIKD